MTIILLHTPSSRMTFALFLTYNLFKMTVIHLKNVFVVNFCATISVLICAAFPAHLRFALLKKYV